MYTYEKSSKNFNDFLFVSGKEKQMHLIQILCLGRQRKINKVKADTAMYVVKGFRIKQITKENK